MPVSLVFGASGAIGRFLLPRLLAAGYDVIASSRVARASGHQRLRWMTGDLYQPSTRWPSADIVFSLGPLDGCAHWLKQAHERYRRLVAIGSQSIDTKSMSIDAAERALAGRLRESEEMLAAAADARACDWTLLRPTLIYGAGLDRSLTPIVRFAERWRIVPRIAQAHGLRQPVHAEDVATACLDIADRPQTAARIYGIGGGERLAFGAMLERVRSSLPFATLPLPIPLSLARAAAGLARKGTAAGAATAAAVARLGADLIVDDAAASADFGWSPRAFHPDAGTWTPPPLP
jgi:nucleoside-diphosphate-sugar epimerase